MINIHHSHIICDDCGERHTPGNQAECIEVLKAMVKEKDDRNQSPVCICEALESCTKQIASLKAERDSWKAAFITVDGMGERAGEIVDKLTTDNTRQAKEIERLRGALKEIANNEVGDCAADTAQDALKQEEAAHD